MIKSHRNGRMNVPAAQMPPSPPHHHQMMLSPPDHQETTNSSETGGSDEADSEMEALQKRQHPHQSLNDSYSYHPFSRGNDDQKKTSTVSSSSSASQQGIRERGHEMSSPESEAMAGIPIVTDTIDDLDEAWECS